MFKVSNRLVLVLYELDLLFASAYVTQSLFTHKISEQDGPYPLAVSVD